MIVVKVGGSLFSQRGWKERLVVWRARQPLQAPHIYLAGGGELADVIRRRQTDWQLDDLAAHELCMSLLAATAKLLAAALQLPVARVGQINYKDASLLSDVILSPETLYEDCGWQNVPKDWSVTSDSLAAMVARFIGAERLVLLKSANPVGQSLQRWADDGFVDPYFPNAAADLLVEWANLADRPTPDFNCGT